MAIKDKRVDDYIAKAQPFAQPVLKRLRKLVHQACPEVQETIKWGFPSFEYKGPFCSMASFKQHAVFGFWKSKFLNDPKKYLDKRAADGGAAMGNLGRITGLHDLPPDRVIVDFIKQAKNLNSRGIQLPPRPRKEKTELIIPAYFLTVVKKNKKALATFEGFSYSNKKEYVEWVTEAITEETRTRRLETAIEWMAEGKTRNWKYVRKGM